MQAAPTGLRAPPVRPRRRREPLRGRCTRRARGAPAPEPSIETVPSFLASFLPSLLPSFLPSAPGRRKESLKCQQPVPSAALPRPQAGGRPWLRRPLPPRAAGRPSLPRYLVARPEREPQRWPRCARCTSLISNGAHSCLQRPLARGPLPPSPPPRTLRKAASPHLHRSPARVFPAFANAPDPRSGSPPSLPLPTLSPREAGRHRGRAGRGDGARRRRRLFRL